MGTITARRVLATNAIGAAGFSILHIALAWWLGRPVNIYLAVTCVLFAVALALFFIAAKHPGEVLFVYCLTVWAAITFMLVHYAGTEPHEQIPSVAWWLLPGAVILGATRNRYTVVYLQACAVTLLWSALLYNDPIDAVTKYPLLVLSGAAGFFYRQQTEGAKGQLDDIDAMLRICNAEKQEGAP